MKAECKKKENIDQVYQVAWELIEWGFYYDFNSNDSLRLTYTIIGVNYNTYFWHIWQKDYSFIFKSIFKDNLMRYVNAMLSFKAAANVS